MTTVDGHCLGQFEELRDLMERHLEVGEDIGASLSIIHQDETVVDLWGGFVDKEKTKVWESNTITNVWSTTKTMASLCALLLVDQKELDLNSPVSHYWPEFSTNGKSDILVRHILAHTSGLSGWEEPMRPEDLYDWEKSTFFLGKQTPWWEPGKNSGYHAITQGFLIGEIIRRITGMKTGAFFRQEFTNPLNADFYIGLPESEDNRVSFVIPPQNVLPLPADQNSAAYKTFMNPGLNPKVPRDAAWRRADIAAANGHGNARSVAEIQSIIAQGGQRKGKLFLSRETIQKIFLEQSTGLDLVLGIPLRFGIGYGLPGETLDYLPSGNICFWGGWGGSLVIVDTDRALTIAYMMNKMGDGILGDDRGAALIKAAYEALEKS